MSLLESPEVEGVAAAAPGQEVSGRVGLAIAFHPSELIISRSHGGLPQLIFALSGTRTLVAMANDSYLFRRYHWLVPFPAAARWHGVRRIDVIEDGRCRPYKLVARIPTVAGRQRKQPSWRNRWGSRRMVIGVDSMNLIGTAPILASES